MYAMKGDQFPIEINVCYNFLSGCIITKLKGNEQANLFVRIQLTLIHPKTMIYILPVTNNVLI